MIDRVGRADRKDAAGSQENGSTFAIVLGTVLDGIPESMVIGLTIFQGGEVGPPTWPRCSSRTYPKRPRRQPASSPEAGERPGSFGCGSQSPWCPGWPRAGYGLFQGSSPDVVAFALAFAGGAILTMLADTMMPEAYKHGGKLVGVVTTLGFVVAFAIHTLA